MWVKTTLAVLVSIRKFLGQKLLARAGCLGRHHGYELNEIVYWWARCLCMLMLNICLLHLCADSRLGIDFPALLVGT
jgi:hypothetical protein